MLCFWETMGAEAGNAFTAKVLYIGIVFVSKRNLLSDKNTKK